MISHNHNNLLRDHHRFSIMNKSRLPWFFLCAFILTAPLIADEPKKIADEPKKKAEKESKESIEEEPHSASDVEPEVVKLPGVFEAVRSTELSVENEHLTSLEIERILPHGASVKKGQPVVWFQTKQLDKKIREAETDLKLAKLTMENDEFAYQQFLKSQQMDKAAAKRARDDARSDYDYFVKTDLQRQIESAKQSLKSSEFNVESTREELDQLQQMYDEDDLTEQSEEIVLRRAKQALESALFRLEGTKIQTKRTIGVMIPRTEIRQENTLDRALMTYDKTMQDLDNARKNQDLEMDRKRRKFDEQKKDFEDMRAERGAVVLKAPHDGIVLYGELTRGKLPAKPVEWKKGSKVAAKQTIATLVDPNRLRVRLDLPESNLELVDKGTKVRIIPTAYDGRILSGTVSRVSTVPFVPGKYDCVVNVGGKRPEGLMPSMTCELELDDHSTPARPTNKNGKDGSK